MLNKKLSEYQAAVIEVNQIEKQIQEFFKFLSIRDNPRFDRCSDYGERSVQITLPFDEINMSYLTEEKIKEIKIIITKHRELRSLQKKLEREVNEFNAVENNIKNNMMDMR